MKDLFVVLKESESEDFKYFLRLNNIYFEVSSYFEDIYFYINTNVNKINIINSFLNRI